MKNKILALLLILLLPAIRSLAAEGITHDISTRSLAITQGGTYTVTGMSYENTITIDVTDNQPVQLILKDIYLQTSNTHPVEIRNGEVRLTLEGSNFLNSNNKSVFQISNNSSLTIDGPGQLNIIAPYNKLSFGDENNPSTPTNVTILGGTIEVQQGQSAPLSIQGGSVRGKFTEKTGKRCATATLVSQDGPMKNKNIATITQPEGYGSLGTQTDNESKLYLWLPTGQQTVSLTMEGDERVFTGSLNVVESQYENDFTISPAGAYRVSYTSNLSDLELKGFPAFVESGKTFTFSTKNDHNLKVISATAEGIDIQPTGKTGQYAFTMPDHDVEIQMKATDLQVITDVEGGTELTDDNLLLIKKAGAYMISGYSYQAITPIRIADDVTGDVTLTLKDLSIKIDDEDISSPPIDCGNRPYQTTLILEGENSLNVSLNLYQTPIVCIAKGSEGTLKIEGTGILKLSNPHNLMIGNQNGNAGNITIAGSSIIIDKYTTEYSVFGEGRDISLTGGSIQAKAGWDGELLTSIGLTDRHLVVVEGCDLKAVIRDFSYGDTPYNLKGMSPDEDGKLYLWLPAGEQALALVTEGNITYKGTVTVAENTINTCTLTAEEGTHSITLAGEDEDLNDHIRIASVGKPGETIVFTVESNGEFSESELDFLLEFDATPVGLEVTRSDEDPTQYSFLMPDENVTLTPRPVAYEVVTDNPDGYRYFYFSADKPTLVITQAGTYTISNMKELPVSGVSIYIANPDRLEDEEEVEVEVEPIGPVTIILDGVNIATGKNVLIWNLSSTETHLRATEGSVNRLCVRESLAIANETGSLTIEGPGKLILEGSGQADLICASARASVTLDNAYLETTNLDEDGLNKDKYGISTQKSWGNLETDYVPYPLAINGGTVIADYIGSPEADPNAPVTISGGSIRCEELRNPVSPDGTGLRLTIVTLPSDGTRLRATGGEEIPVASYSGLGGYSLDNTYADSEGHLYLWLPEGATYPDVRVNNGVGSVTAGQDVTLSLEEIIPDVTYYAVTIPTVEGATTQPGAGTYTVEEGTDFSFTLTLAEGYEQSVPTVTLSDGRVLTPDSRSQYVISYITTDLAVSITGIEPNIPTGIASAGSDDIQIEAGTGCLRIHTPRPVSIQIVRTNGEPSIVKVPAGDTHVDGLPSGIYFVRPDGQPKARKLIVH